MRRITVAVLALFLLLASGYSMRDWPGWASAFLQGQEEQQTDEPERRPMNRSSLTHRRYPTGRRYPICRRSPISGSTART